LRTLTYPKDCTSNQKRAIRKKGSKFTLKDHLLYLSTQGKLKQWITDERQQRRIVESCHADKLGGHFGRDKTREKVSSRLVLVECISKKNGTKILGRALHSIPPCSECDSG
jgi:hypothetical protein